jgi:hypothetical protein
MNAYSRLARRVISRNYENLSQTVLFNALRARYKSVVALDARVSASATSPEQSEELACDRRE